jgi:hypothetical protein
VMLAAGVPLTIALALAYGAAGGAAAWLCVHVLGMLLGSGLTHRYLLKGGWSRWIALDVGVPAAVSAAAGWLALQTAPAGSGPLWRLAVGLAWALCAFAVTVAASPALRASLLQYARDFAQWTALPKRHD